MRRLRQRLPHQAGRADGKIEPGVVIHLDAGANAVSRLADQMGDGAAEFDFRRGVGFVAALVLEALQSADDCASRPAATRHNKARHALIGPRQCEKHVRVGNREEPFVSDDRPGAVAVRRLRCV